MEGPACWQKETDVAFRGIGTTETGGPAGDGEEKTPPGGGLFGAIGGVVREEAGTSWVEAAQGR